MKLPAYIKMVGDEAFGELIGVSRYTARSWRTKERTPRPKHAKVITKKTPLKLVDIYGA